MYKIARFFLRISTSNSFKPYAYNPAANATCTFPLYFKCGISSASGSSEPSSMIVNQTRRQRYSRQEDLAIIKAVLEQQTNTAKEEDSSYSVPSSSSNVDNTSSAKTKSINWQWIRANVLPHRSVASLSTRWKSISHSINQHSKTIDSEDLQRNVVTEEHANTKLEEIIHRHKNRMKWTKEQDARLEHLIFYENMMGKWKQLSMMPEFQGWSNDKISRRVRNVIIPQRQKRKISKTIEFKTSHELKQQPDQKENTLVESNIQQIENEGLINLRKETFRPPAQPWSAEEDKKLMENVEILGLKFSYMTSDFPGRTAADLAHHYWNSLHTGRSTPQPWRKTGCTHQPWTAEEDALLISTDLNPQPGSVGTKRERIWVSLAKKLQRGVLEVRRRWWTLKGSKGWTPEEDRILKMGLIVGGVSGVGKVVGDAIGIRTTNDVMKRALKLAKGGGIPIHDLQSRVLIGDLTAKEKKKKKGTTKIKSSTVNEETDSICSITTHSTPASTKSQKSDIRTVDAFIKLNSENITIEKLQAAFPQHSVEFLNQRLHHQQLKFSPFTAEEDAYIISHLTNLASKYNVTPKEFILSGDLLRQTYAWSHFCQRFNRHRRSIARRALRLIIDGEKIGNDAIGKKARRVNFLTRTRLVEYTPEQRENIVKWLDRLDPACKCIPWKDMMRDLELPIDENLNLWVYGNLFLWPWNGNLALFDEVECMISKLDEGLIRKLKHDEDVLIADVQRRNPATIKVYQLRYDSKNMDLKESGCTNKDTESMSKLKNFWKKQADEYIDWKMIKSNLDKRWEDIWKQSRVPQSYIKRFRKLIQKTAVNEWYDEGRLRRRWLYLKEWQIATGRSVLPNKKVEEQMALYLQMIRQK